MAHATKHQYISRKQDFTSVQVSEISENLKHQFVKETQWDWRNETKNILVILAET